MAKILFATLLAGYVTHLVSATYSQVQDYSGDTFFDGWNFFTGEDPTSGFVQFQDRATATSNGLIKTQSLNSTSSKQVYIGVDRDNVTPNGRPSTRIESKVNFNHALVLADIAHAPGGICGTWPAFWMLGEDPWPFNGEIDIVEGVNDQSTNAMTLHTSAGVFLDVTHQYSASIGGTVVTPNCDVNATDQSANSGCTIKDDSDLSFGTAFNDNGGGVYATEWTSDFIKIWFFPRNKIPSDIQAGDPVPSTSWGNPASLFTGNFDIDSHFKDLRLIFDTTFCGDYAGAVFSSSPTCASKAATCNDFVQNNPSAFVDAYWLVNSVKVFQDDGQSGSNVTATATATITATVTATGLPTAQPTVVTNGTSPGTNPGTSPPGTTPDANPGNNPYHGHPHGHPGGHGRPPSLRFKKRSGGAVISGMS